MDTLSEARQQVLGFLKEHPGATISEVSSRLDVSYEGARQQLAQLERDGLIERSLRRPDEPTGGRPASVYRLTDRGEDLFPKAYDQLAVEVIDAVASDLGSEALRKVFTSLVDDRVRRWQSQLEGLTLDNKLHELRDLYAAGDPFTSVEGRGDDPVLIERNCPFLSVASRRPALCSVTVSMLQRLLGYRVERVERFQTGHGRCVFRVRRDEPVAAPEFSFEAPNAPVEGSRK